uniref:pectinesterase n=1 Tax=Cajanus cajan TaxID=3821 RepID=A0A151U751_CAJCA|nr:Pectinesterase PPME1 [Cajanus cajan]
MYEFLGFGIACKIWGFRKKILDPNLVAAEEGAKVVKVMQDGSGEFKTITDAIKSVLDGNAKHVIFYIGVGNYNEKKPKAQQNMSSITFARTAKTYGNSTPRPDEKMVGVQAIVLRISGDKETFYNCKIYGLQDIVCYDRNKHFFKDFLIQGIMDNIFGSAKSIYLVHKIL